MKYLSYILIILFLSCHVDRTEKKKKKSFPSHRYTFVDVKKSDLNYCEKNYLPVYSEIYHMDGRHSFKLATTVSIRNSSMTDSAYVFTATHYDSYGKKLAEYVDKPVLLTPLESIEFVVHDDGPIGGAGDNFIIDWGAVKYSNQLLIQAIMIGTYNQQSVSFLSNAKVIERKQTK
jgi:hypothetical protein